MAQESPLSLISCRWRVKNKNAQYGTGTHSATIVAIVVCVLIRYFSGVASLLSKQTTTEEHKFIINPVYVELHNLETNFRKVVHLRPLHQFGKPDIPPYQHLSNSNLYCTIVMDINIRLPVTGLLQQGTYATTVFRVPSLSYSL